MSRALTLPLSLSLIACHPSPPPEGQEDVRALADEAVQDSLEALLGSLQEPENVEKLVFLLEHLETADGDLTFHSTNLRLVSGSGATDDGGAPTGLGNLLIGYGETGEGAHCLVIGEGHQWRGTGCAIVGRDHIVDADGAVALAGAESFVTGEGGAAIAGDGNQVSGASSAAISGADLAVLSDGGLGGGGIGTVISEEALYGLGLGGSTNRITTAFSMVLGGDGNVAGYDENGGSIEPEGCGGAGDYAMVIGSRQSYATGEYSAIVGAEASCADGQGAGVFGGGYNLARGLNAAAVGGWWNRAIGDRSLM